MARKTVPVEYSNFTNGFITEASPLTFPENASLDEENININRDGTRQRRFGMDWPELAHEVSKASPLSTSGYATSSFAWMSAGNDGTQNLGVLQHGKTLYFYDLDEVDVSNAHIQTLVLGISDAPSFTKQFSFTSAYGKLIIATSGKSVVVCSWDGTTVTSQRSGISVRDRWGVDDGLAVDSQPITLSTSHLYNLRNQGWPSSMTCASDAGGSTVSIINQEPVNYTFTKVGFYPSNADLVWASKLGVVTGIQTDNIGAYSPWELKKQIFGTTQAPQGKFVIDLFDRNDGTLDSREGQGFPLGGSLPFDKSEGGVKSVASFAGRVWYSVFESSLIGGDDRTPNIGNMVLYSQATDDLSRWGSCHTSNDPTAEDYNDVLASDGGYISLPESGEIQKLVPLGESLFIFASNGVWEVFGGEGVFSASEQSVVKVTDFGSISSKSIVAGGNVVAYWSESGIYSITLDQTSLRGIATNITETTIQTYYDDIPLPLKEQAIGSYDIVARQAVWLYNLTAKDSEYYFDKELVLDINKGAFTKRSINALDKSTGHGPYITSYLPIRNLLQGVTQEVVTDGGVDVTDSSVDVTTTISNAEQKTKSSLMYWIVDYNGTNEIFRLGGYLGFNFTDYSKVQGVLGNYGSDAPAYILTGALTGGDSSRLKWAPYVSVKLKRTESDWIEDGSGNITLIGESSCTLQGQWEWTNNILSGKWTNPQQVYRLPRFISFDPSHIFSFDVVNTRNKLRGNGKALSLKFTSSPLKDMYILGWGLDVSMKEQV